MSYMKTLPVLPGTKFIVIDEDTSAMHARSLVFGWCQACENETFYDGVDFLLFCNSKDGLEQKILPVNLRIHDYYTVDINNCETQDLETLEKILQTFNSENIVVIDSLNILILNVGLPKTLRFVEKLSKQVSQLICIYQRDTVQNKIPNIVTLGTTYIKLHEAKTSCLHHLIYNATIYYRKLNGSVICQTEVIKQNIESPVIIVEEVQQYPMPLEANRSEPVKIESSFKIEIDAQEMEQRNKTPLPYTLNAATTSKIIYQPDAEDDIDEEDPDDDLLNI